MSKTKKTKTVYAEGESVVTSTSPYDQYRDVEFEYVSEDNKSDVEHSQTNNLKKRLRLECLKIALADEGTVTQENVINRAKRYYQYVKTGE